MRRGISVLLSEKLNTYTFWLGLGQTDDMDKLGLGQNKDMNKPGHG